MGIGNAEGGMRKKKEGVKMRRCEKSRSGGWGDWERGREGDRRQGDGEIPEGGSGNAECRMQKKKEEEHRRVGGTWRRDELEIKTGEIKAASILVC